MIGGSSALSLALLGPGGIVCGSMLGWRLSSAARQAGVEHADPLY
jgi:hypothetical protein